MGWVIGYVVGAVIVVAVAVLAITLILQARKIGKQAADIVDALERARDNTAGLWEVDSVNRSLDSIRAAARAARVALTGGSS